MASDTAGPEVSTLDVTLLVAPVLDGSLFMATVFDTAVVAASV